MNPMARPLAWLRDALILTDEQLPQQLDAGGGTRPVFDVGQGGEPYLEVRTELFSITAANGAAPGFRGFGSVPNNLSPGFEAPQDRQIVVIGISSQFAGGVIRRVALYVTPPGTTGIPLLLADSVEPNAATNLKPWKEIWNAPRLVLPPGWGVSLYNLAAFAGADSTAFTIAWGYIPRGMKHF